MAEKSILAYFQSRQQAESCVPKLRALRAADIQIDQFGEYPGHGVEETFNPLSNSDFPGLAYLTLGGSGMSQDARILTAVDVDASGMADGSRELLAPDPEDMTRRDILLTVVLDEATYDQAMRVIREAGGNI